MDKAHRDEHLWVRIRQIYISDRDLQLWFVEVVYASYLDVPGRNLPILEGLHSCATSVHFQTKLFVQDCSRETVIEKMGLFGRQLFDSQRRRFQAFDVDLKVKLILRKGRSSVRTRPEGVTFAE